MTNDHITRGDTWKHTSSEAQTREYTLMSWSMSCWCWRFLSLEGLKTSPCNVTPTDGIGKGFTNIMIIIYIIIIHSSCINWVKKWNEKFQCKRFQCKIIVSNIHFIPICVSFVFGMEEDFASASAVRGPFGELYLVSKCNFFFRLYFYVLMYFDQVFFCTSPRVIHTDRLTFALRVCVFVFVCKRKAHLCVRPIWRRRVVAAR